MTIKNVKYWGFICGLFCFGFTWGQVNAKSAYHQAFHEQQQMLSGEKPIDFKRAVFLSESAYSGGTLSYAAFNANIQHICTKLDHFIAQRQLHSFKTAANYAVFSYMMDSLPMNNYAPYGYDFEDFMGEEDWSSMFVTRLISTRKGNCHSLPYLYKILCEEMGAEARLALAPNHIYIKHIDESGQWANVELTNGGFPRDQWIISQMAISVEAIKAEVYMKPLSPRESIALTMFDLACGYEAKFGVDSFYITVINQALEAFPTCIPLLISKANYYGLTGMDAEKIIESTPEELKEIFDRQVQVFDQIKALGYKEMPPELYEQWVLQMEKEKQKKTTQE